MDERVVTSKKGWSGIEEKMPEISSELNELAENLTVSTPSRGKFGKVTEGRD